MAGLPRADALRIAAETRVAVLEMLGSALEPISLDDLWGGLAPAAAEATTRKAFENLIWNMKNNGLIKATKGSHPVHGVPINLYYVDNSAAVQQPSAPQTASGDVTQLCVTALKAWRALEEFKRQVSALPVHPFAAQIEAMEKAAAKQRDMAISAVDK